MKLVSLLQQFNVVIDATINRNRTPHVCKKGMMIMCNVKLINKEGKVVDQFQYHKSIVKMLSFYEALGYQLDISDVQ